MSRTRLRHVEDDDVPPTADLLRRVRDAVTEFVESADKESDSDAISADADTPC